MWSDLCGLYTNHERREELRPRAQKAHKPFWFEELGTLQVINTTGFPDLKPVTQSHRLRRHSLKSQPYLPKGWIVLVKAQLFFPFIIRALFAI